MHTFNIWIKLKENPIRSNGRIYILDQENNKEKVKKKHNILHTYIDHTPQSTN